MERQRDYVLRTVEERGVRLIRLWFTDVLGQLKSFAISPAELEGAFDEGMRFDGSAIDGFSRVQQIGSLSALTPSSRTLVFERSLAVGSVPSIQMYSALYAIGFLSSALGVGGDVAARAWGRGCCIHAGSNFAFSIFPPSRLITRFRS